MPGKFGDKQLEKYMFFFFTYVFWRAGGGRIGDEQKNPYKYQFFLGGGRRMAGWGQIGEERPNRIQVFFSWLVTGNFAARKIWKKILFKKNHEKPHIFWRAGCGKLGDIMKLLWLIVRK